MNTQTDNDNVPRPASGGGGGASGGAGGGSGGGGGDHRGNGGGNGGQAPDPGPAITRAEWASILLTGGLLIAAAWGLWHTSTQIQAASDQIAGSTLYQVARDGRELMSQARKGKAEDADVLSYFHATYLLHERGVLDSDGWIPLRRSYCYFIKGSETARAYLAKYKDRYDPDFISFSSEFEGGATCA